MSRIWEIYYVNQIATFSKNYPDIIANVGEYEFERESKTVWRYDYELKSRYLNSLYA